MFYDKILWGDKMAKDQKELYDDAVSTHRIWKEKVS